MFQIRKSLENCASTCFPNHHGTVIGRRRYKLAVRRPRHAAIETSCSAKSSDKLDTLRRRDWQPPFCLGCWLPSGGWHTMILSGCRRRVNSFFQTKEVGDGYANRRWDFTERRGSVC